MRLFRFNPFESHHLYWGLIVCGVGYHYDTVWLYVVGMVLVYDDLWQHHKQVQDPEYHSIIHQLYGRYLYKFSWIRKLNIMVDKLFGE